MYPSLFAFCSGVLLVHFSPSPFVTLTIFVAVCSFVCACCYFCRAHSCCSVQGFLKRLPIALFWCLFGVCYASWEASVHLNAQVDEQETGEYAQVHGYLCGIPKNNDFGVHVAFCADNGRYLLSLPYDVLRVESGMCWQGRVKLKAPRSTFNPWSGSYERFLFAERIVGFASAKTFERVDCTFQQRASSFITQQRWRLKRYLESQLSGFDQAGVVIALVLGHRAEISTHQSEVLRASGTQHLMAISGLHVGIVCWLVFFVLQKTGVRRFVFTVVGLVGFAYIAMVGFSSSAQRAYVMMLCAMAALSGRIPGSLWSAYLLALALVLLLDPLAPLSPGFWFSFVAVFWLILIYHTLLRGRSFGLLTSMIVLQCALALGLMPIQAHFSMPTSVFSLPANVVAIPWVSVVVLPLSLLSVLVSALLPVISEFGFASVDTILSLLFAFLALGLEFDVVFKPGFEAATTSIFEHAGGVLFTFSYFVLLVFLLILGRLRVLSLAVGLLLLIIMLLLNPRFDSNKALPSSSSAPAAQLSVLDVGQGLSLVAHQKDSLWIYDTGPSYTKYSSAKAVLVSYIRRHAAFAKNKYLIVSHGDADHAGDAHWLAARLQPTAVLLGEPKRTEMPTEQIVRPCVSGQSLGGNRFSMSVLWPITNPPAKQHKGNARSCVVRFTLHGHRFLVMGDLEGEHERAFIRHYLQSGKFEELRSDVLIAGHHGAKAATNTSLLKHVKPSHVVFSAGYANRFGHPSAEATERVMRFGAQVLITAGTGALIFTVEDSSASVEDGLVIERTRSQSSDYWLAR
jgi:competence protein ComEC